MVTILCRNSESGLLSPTRGQRTSVVNGGTSKQSVFILKCRPKKGRLYGFLQSKSLKGQMSFCMGILTKPEVVLVPEF